MKIKPNKKIALVVTTILVAIAVVFLLGFLWRISQHDKFEAKKSEESALMTKVGKLLSLPNEKPIISTIQNKEDFKNETFYSKIETGDKLIVYLNADQSIFYRPSSNTVTMLLPVSAYIRSTK